MEWVTVTSPGVLSMQVDGVGNDGVGCQAPKLKER